MMNSSDQLSEQFGLQQQTHAALVFGCQASPAWRHLRLSSFILVVPPGGVDYPLERRSIAGRFPPLFCCRLAELLHRAQPSHFPSNG